MQIDSLPAASAIAAGSGVASLAISGRPVGGMHGLGISFAGLAIEPGDAWPAPQLDAEPRAAAEAASPGVLQRLALLISSFSPPPGAESSAEIFERVLSLSELNSAKLKLEVAEALRAIERQEGNPAAFRTWCAEDMLQTAAVCEDLAGRLGSATEAAASGHAAALNESSVPLYPGSLQPTAQLPRALLAKHPELARRTSYDAPPPRPAAERERTKTSNRNSRKEGGLRLLFGRLFAKAALLLKHHLAGK